MVGDAAIHRHALFAKRHICIFQQTVPINMTNENFWSGPIHRPYPQGTVPGPGGAPYMFVEHWQIHCTATVATASVSLVRNGTPIGSPLTPVANSVVESAVLLPNAAFQGWLPNTDGLQIQCTTNGFGTITNLYVVITLRPFPLAGDVGR